MRPLFAALLTVFVFQGPPALLSNEAVVFHNKDVQLTGTLTFPSA